MALSTNIYLRQLDIINKEKFNTPICIIGAGATGSILCFMLTKMGMNNIRLWDHDFVAEHNSSNQLFKVNDINLNKAERTAQICEDFNGIKIRHAACRYERQPLNGIVIAGVDSMKGRKEIFEKCKKMEDVTHFLDPRSGPEYGRVYTIDMRLKKEQEFWESTYYNDNITEPLNCTNNAVIYGVGFLSALITNQIKKIIMGQNYFTEIMYDLVNLQILVK